MPICHLWSIATWSKVEGHPTLRQ